MISSVPFNDLKREYKTIKNEIDIIIQEVIDNTAFIKGKYLKQFEEDLAHYCGTEHAIGCSSGTTAIHLALEAFGIGEGDEVITVSNTFIGTTEPITHTGAKIVFVDIDKDNYTIDPSKIEAAITPNTKAIVPVHLFGQISDMEKICDIAKRHNLYVVEDAAQAIGAEYKGKKVGHYGDAACFSFYPGKNLGAYGDAGAVVTNNSDAAHKIRILSDHGRQSKYTHEIEGYNYRMDAIQAAILTVKLKKIDEWNDARRKVADFYCGNLNMFDIELPVENPDMRHVYHVFCTRVENRENLQNKLKDKGVSSGIHYPVPLHVQPAYSYMNIKEGTLPVTEKYADEILSLPIFPFMNDDEMKYTIDVLSELL
ncbi:DegT/DnrJ/EryC1/StrS family aminotransferase [candidate division KSB1 bacterium]